MKYDPSRPVAVFLGPSLARHKAERVLAANYYPPAKMGDVYRLLGSGVRTVVLIDGVFHNSTPVWQRELLAAIDAGITVVGACSMGALRAAELDALGMVGHGTIYGWYRDGLIDGDDEVALQHTDAEMGWQPLSEPLVNIRHNLARAVEEALLTPDEAARTVGELKGVYFGLRSHHRLLQTEAVRSLPDARRLALADLLTDRPANLKQEDALGVLRWCAAHPDPRPAPAAAQALPRPTVPTAYGAYETLLRGAWRADGTLQPLRDAWQALLAQPQALATLTQSAHGDFFLEQALAALPALPGPAAAASPPDDALRMVALTRAEHQRLATRRARLEAALGVPLAQWDAALAPHDQAAAALGRWYGRGQSAAQVGALHATLRRRARAGALVTRWARGHGIEAPSEVTQAFTAGWLAREGFNDASGACAALDLAPQVFHAVWADQALYQWLLDQGPACFGWETFTPAVAVLQDLQLAGTLAPWLDMPATEEAGA